MNFHNIILTVPDSIFSQRGRILTRMIGNRSYGGHYGPYSLSWQINSRSFAAQILQQNERIKDGTINGTEIPLATLGMVNGL